MNNNDYFIRTSKFKLKKDLIENNTQKLVTPKKIVNNHFKK